VPLHYQAVMIVREVVVGNSGMC